MTKKLTAALLIAAALLANAAFTALGSIFNYPDVLDEPAGEVLAAFRDHQGAVSTWFIVLALSAALFAPIAIGVGKLRAQPRLQTADGGRLVLREGRHVHRGPVRVAPVSLAAHQQFEDSPTGLAVQVEVHDGSRGRLVRVGIDRMRLSRPLGVPRV